MTSTLFSTQGSFVTSNPLINVLLARYNMTIFDEIRKKAKGLMIKQSSSAGLCITYITIIKKLCKVFAKEKNKKMTSFPTRKCPPNLCPDILK